MPMYTNSLVLAALVIALPNPLWYTILWIKKKQHVCRDFSVAPVDMNDERFSFLTTSLLIFPMF